MKAQDKKNKQQETLEDRDDLVSVVGTKGDESPRRESIVDIDEERGPDAAVEPSYLDDELDETMELEGTERPLPTDRPADITPRGTRSEAGIGLSLKSDKELMDDYEEKAAEDRRGKKTG